MKTATTITMSRIEYDIAIERIAALISDAETDYSTFSRYMLITNLETIKGTLQQGERSCQL